MAKFSYAWHAASGTMMDVNDVIEFFLRTGHAPELMCPDEACREESPMTRLVSVCCDPRNRRCAVVPHFRTSPGQPHGENCQIHTIAKQIDYILANKSKFSAEFPTANLLLDVKGVASDLVPDMYVSEFRPRDFLDEIQKKARTYQRDGATRDDALRKARCAVPQRTSRLALVVDSALSLEKHGGEEALRSASLALPERSTPIPYLKAFFNIQFLRSEYAASYIFFGKAHIHETREGFLVEYTRKLKNYSKQYGELSACTPLTFAECPAALQNELHEYASSGRPCCVYSFSAHALHENDCPILNTPRCVVFRPKIRGAVVLREQVLKERQFKNS